MHFEIDIFKFCSYRLVDHRLHHHNHSLIDTPFAAVGGGDHHCGKRILDEIDAAYNGVPYISELDSYHLLLPHHVFVRGWPLLSNNAIRNLVKCVYWSLLYLLLRLRIARVAHL